MLIKYKNFPSSCEPHSDSVSGGKLDETGPVYWEFLQLRLAILGGIFDVFLVGSMYSW